MKILADAIFIIIAIHAASFIDFDKEAVKALVSGILLGFWLCMKFYKK